MSEDTEYAQLLAEAIENRRAHVAEKVIPELKEAFRAFHSSYQGLWNILQRKGLIQEDPYKNDQKISDAVAPSDESFMESEKDQQMSVRLSAFDNTLDYLTNYFEFSLDHMDLRRVKNLVGIANYIKWNNLSETSPKFTTRALAEYAGKLRGEADTLSINLLKDAVEQLSKTQRNLLSYLKQIAEVKKAEYKLYLREEVVPEAEFDPNSAYQNREKTLRAMKKAYSAKNRAVPSSPSSPASSLKRITARREKPSAGRYSMHSPSKSRRRRRSRSRMCCAPSSWTESAHLPGSAGLSSSAWKRSMKTSRPWRIATRASATACESGSIDW